MSDGAFKHIKTVQELYAAFREGNVAGILALLVPDVESSEPENRKKSSRSGGELAGQFYDRGLLDEMFVQVGSVTLGAGKSRLPCTENLYCFVQSSARRCV